MQPETLVSRTPDILSAPVDDDIVFLSPTLNSYIALDDIGRRIWDLLEQPRRVAELVGTLESEFQATNGEIASDLDVFLTRLAKEGLIRVDPASD